MGLEELSPRNIWDKVLELERRVANFAQGIEVICKDLKDAIDLATQLTSKLEEIEKSIKEL